MAFFRFFRDALSTGHVYVDIDGCLLHKMPIPDYVPPNRALDYWMRNLCVTKVIWKRLVLLYFLRLLGVRLHLWTNRSPQHEPVTRRSLGRHYRMFTSHGYWAGQKRHYYRRGPCIDDELRNIGTQYADLLVAPPKCRRDLLSLWKPAE